MAIVSTFLSKYRNIGVSVTISGNWYRENGDVPSSGCRSPCGKKLSFRMFNCYRIRKHGFCQQFWVHFLKIVRYFGFYNLRFTGYHESESARFHHRFRCGCEIWFRSQACVLAPTKYVKVHCRFTQALHYYSRFIWFFTFA